MIGGAQRPDGPHGRASNPHPEPTEPNQPNRSKPPKPTHPNRPTGLGKPVRDVRSGWTSSGMRVQGVRFRPTGTRLPELARPKRPTPPLPDVT